MGLGSRPNPQHGRLECLFLW